MVRCEGCGRTLKNEALFCTGCGTRREATPPPAPRAVSACAKCGNELRADAEFCTECGSSAARGPIDLTVEEAAAAGVGVATGATAASAASPDDGAGSSPAERVSPAASRAILGSVSGGMGTYVGKKTAGPSSAPPPPGTGTTAPEEDDGRRKLAVAAIVAVVVLLIGGIAVLVVTQQGNDSALHAGGAVNESSSARISSAGTTTGSTDGSTGTSTATGSSSSKSSSSKSSSSKSSGSKSSSSKSSGSKSSSSKSTGSKSSSSKSSGSKSSSSKSTGSKSSGGSSGTAAPQTQPSPAPLAPARLSLGTSHVSMSGTSGGSFTVRNTGQRTMSWRGSVSLGGVPGGHVWLSPSSGSVAAGSSVTVNVSWSSWGSSSNPDEGVYTGSISISAGSAGGAYASLTADNRAADAVRNVYKANCNSDPNYRCAAGSTIRVQVNRNASGSFIGANLTDVYFQVAGESTIEHRGLNESAWGLHTYPGQIAEFTVPVSYHGFNTGANQITMWTVDAAGVTSAHQTVAIFS